MKMKSNPMLSLVALLLMLALLATVCSGCGATPAETEEPEEPKRFTSEEEVVSFGLSAHIITDTETGVQYLVVDAGYGAGVTVLQPASDKED